MKKLVSFEEYNAIEFCGHDMHICDSKDEAEFEIVLMENDKLVKTDEGMMLVRNGIWYSQVTKMKKFKGVNFVSSEEGKSVQARLIKLN